MALTFGALFGGASTSHAQAAKYGGTPYYNWFYDQYVYYYRVYQNSTDSNRYNVWYLGFAYPYWLYYNACVYGDVDERYNDHNGSRSRYYKGSDPWWCYGYELRAKPGDYYWRTY